MAVYTHFSGMPAVVHAVIAEAFARLDAHLASQLIRLDGTDPIAELRAIALAYRDNALANPHLYAVMFGGPAAVGMELTADDLAVARGSLRTVVEAAGRARDRGLLIDIDEWELARRFWAAGHGAILLELGGYLGPPPQAERTYVALTETVLTGLRRSR
jgi:AcrR family transcriptional regulator